MGGEIGKRLACALQPRTLVAALDNTQLSRAWSQVEHLHLALACENNIARGCHIAHRIHDGLRGVRARLPQIRIEIQPDASAHARGEPPHVEVNLNLPRESSAREHNNAGYEQLWQRLARR